MAEQSSVLTLRIPGTEEPGAPKREGRSIQISEQRTYRIAAARAAEVPRAVHDSDPGELVEVEFEDGTRVWTSRQRLCNELIPDRERKRSVDGALELPVGLARQDASRGIVGRVLFKTLSFFRVDVGEMTARLLAEKWEEHTLGSKEMGLGPGLYRCSAKGDFSLTRWNERSESLSADRPTLLFLHGTASSTRGSFGGLWEPDKTDLREELFKPYGANVLALEHATLSASPVQNVIDLVEALPSDARLHLVSHSRGGLVGELLCRKMAAGAREPFSADELEAFSRKDPEGSRGDLAKLNRLLKEKPFTVDRFVRVACPAWGTTLASKRFDIYLSILFNLLSKVPFLSSVPGFKVVHDIFSELVMLVAKERSDPSVLPGIEAMIPGSPLVQLLNRPDCTVDGELRVIAGDIEGETILSALGTLATDPLYQRDNDLVVDTEAMFGGADRTGGAAFSFHQGPHVSHFRYFKNDESAGRLLKTLTRGADEQDGFEPFNVRRSDADFPAYDRAVTGPQRPIVFLLPGIMGSHLAVGTDRIWLDPISIAFGKFDALRIDAPGVKAEAPVWMAYGDLVNRLSSTHEVIPFAYDWRLSLETEAARLAGEIDKAIKRGSKAAEPVSIVAHSMGGLLARALIATQRATWDSLCQHPEARLIMLGTPNEGSYCIPQVLTGRDSLIKKLALLDMKHDLDELLGIISAYPGVLELLPGELLDPAAWEPFMRDDPRRADWHVPPAAALQEARRVRDSIATGPLDPARVFYLAGHAPSTPSGMTIVKEGDSESRLVFFATQEGDGRVPWKTGIPEGLTPWYAPAAHGDLAKQEDCLGAIVDLLRNGSTDRLNTSAPVSRGLTAEVELPEEISPLYTGFDDLAHSAVGISPDAKRAKPRHRVKVSVVHGNLAFTHQPVMVGHYQGDSIVSAEAHLDRVMGGRLRDRHHLGLYPGADHSAEVFLCPGRQPGGAIIIGLGDVGKLSPGKLMRAVSRGVRAYAVSLAENVCGVEDAGMRSQTAGIATLLVGTNAGGVSLEDSVTAILRGIADASQTLKQQGFDGRVLFDELEIIELYEDRAIQAVHALERAKMDPEIARSFVIDPALRVKISSGGLRRASYAEEDPWWQRLQIEEDPFGRLTFNVLTERARAEVHIQQGQKSQADEFIDEIRSSTDAGSDAVAVTLFEMLIPNELKDYAPDRRDLVLVLNEEAARYPWEMLKERPDHDRGMSEMKPLSVQAGMIRQLQTREYRSRVVTARGNAALVVGNPPTDFVNLPGAEGEARAVHKLLRELGYQSVEKIGSDATSGAILKELYARDYRIVHLAGHGVYEYEEELDVPCECCGTKKIVRKTTGMVIGRNKFLTPTQLQQMRVAPDLVFVNCCHLGRVENVGDKLPRNHPPKLAANIATELIRMGVKAVVAAGWEVNDDAAQLFAKTFYKTMLSGTSFGEAVHKARCASYDAYPGINTWGAYQCYGDHAFRLVRTGAPKPSKNAPPRFAAPVEVVTRLDNITQQAKTADDKRQGALRESVAAIQERIPADWRGMGEVLAALGRAWGELEDFGKAVECYRNAVSDEKAPYSVKSVEQLWNLQARWAVERWRKDPKGNVDESREMILDSETNLHALMKLMGETTERLSLLGSAAKREAVIAEDRGGKKLALEKMAEQYKAAFEHGKQTDPYPQLNRLTASVLLSILDPTVKPLRGLRSMIEKARLAAITQQKGAPDFWNAVMIPDSLLLGHLAAGNLALHADEVIERYEEVNKSFGSPREIRLVLEHLDFLENIVAAAPDKPKMESTLAALWKIRDALEIRRPASL